MRVSTLLRCPCSISIHLSFRSVTAGVRPFQFVGHVAFLFICFPGLSLLVSALFRWPCSISIHLSPRSVTAAAFLFICLPGSFVSQVCHCWCPPFSAGHVAFLFICLPGLSLLVSALFFWPCSISIHLSPKCGCPPFSVAHAAFLFICLPGLSLLVSALFSSLAM